MSHGHDPREVDTWPVRDVWTFMEMYPVIQSIENPFAGGFDE
ncbi:hypothetical protein [Haladaptatus pallidirubidus]